MTRHQILLRGLGMSLAFGPIAAVRATEPDPALWEQWSAQAATAYGSGNALEAANLYGRIIEQGGTSADAYFNQGTAELKAGRRGAAILAFERALRLRPGDPDVLHNLAEAERDLVDQLGGTQEVPSIAEKLGERIPTDLVAILFVAGWILGLGALAGRRLEVRGPWGLVATGGLGLAALAAGLLWTVSASHAARTAIVVAPTTALRDGPAADFRPSAELHEGARLRVVETRSDFARVRLGNGTEGWVEVASAPEIMPAPTSSVGIQP